MGDLTLAALDRVIDDLAPKKPIAVKIRCGVEAHRRLVSYVSRLPNLRYDAVLDRALFNGRENVRVDTLWGGLPIWIDPDLPTYVSEIEYSDGHRERVVFFR